MKIHFTKMHGAGNDFIVLDETKHSLGLSSAQYRWLADRHFGIGADQILSVHKVAQKFRNAADFEYRIHNADGGEVEQCGNGARCFARYVYDKKLTQQKRIRVLTKAGIIAPHIQDDGRVTVDMGKPRFLPEHIPFNPEGLCSKTCATMQLWSFPLPAHLQNKETSVWLGLVSMGNPHAVIQVDDCNQANVLGIGAYLESIAHFPQRVNVGFMQIVSQNAVELRVYERGVGETLACGTGACAAVVSAIRQGLLQSEVQVQTRGGSLSVAWSGRELESVFMTGPAETIFEGQIEIPILR